MQTLSTRLFGMIEVGQVGRGYVIGILLVLISAVFLWAGTRFVSGRSSYPQITGKGTWWRWHTCSIRRVFANISSEARS